MAVVVRAGLGVPARVDAAAGAVGQLVVGPAVRVNDLDLVLAEQVDARVRLDRNAELEVQLAASELGAREKIGRLPLAAVQQDARAALRPEAAIVGRIELDLADALPGV